MRLVLFVNKFPVLSETFIVAKFIGLLQRGWDIHIVCQNSTNPGSWKNFPVLDNIANVRDRVHDDLHSITEINDRIYALDPDLIHFEFGSLAVGRMYLKELANCQIIVHFRGYDVNYFGLDQPSCYEEVWERADALIFMSQDLWRRAQQRGCPADKRSFCIRYGLDASEFDPGERQHQDVAGMVSRPLRILSVGRLVWKKGYEYGLQAVRRLLDAGISCEYHIVGAGEYHNELVTTAYQLDLHQQVQFLGGQPLTFVKKELLWADVLLHPAVSEGFCLAALEAQAMKVPVVCTDADGLSENVADGCSGFVVSRRDPVAMATKMELLAQNPKLRQAMGSAGRKRAFEQFSQDAYLSSYEPIYREVLNGST